MELDTISRFRAMAAFCNQRSKMQGEDEQLWRREANDWSMLLSTRLGDEWQARGEMKNRAEQRPTKRQAVKMSTTIVAPPVVKETF